MKLPCVGLCEHMYICNCEDKEPLCKHIHKIHAFFKTNTAIVKTDDDMTTYFDSQTQGTLNEDEFHFVDPPSPPATRFEDPTQKELEKYNNNIAELISLMENANIKKLMLSNVNTRLGELIRQAKAFKNMEEKPKLEPMETSYTFKPNEKLDHQWQPSKFRKTKKEICQPKKFCPISSEKKAEIVKQLIKGCAKEDNAETIEDEKQKMETTKKIGDKKLETEKTGKCVEKREKPSKTEATFVSVPIKDYNFNLIV